MVTRLRSRSGSVYGPLSVRHPVRRWWEGPGWRDFGGYCGSNCVRVARQSSLQGVRNGASRVKCSWRPRSGDKGGSFFLRCISVLLMCFAVVSCGRIGPGFWVGMTDRGVSEFVSSEDAVVPDGEDVRLAGGRSVLFTDGTVLDRFLIDVRGASVGDFVAGILLQFSSLTVVLDRRVEGLGSITMRRFVNSIDDLEDVFVDMARIAGVRVDRRGEGYRITSLGAEGTRDQIEVGASVGSLLYLVSTLDFGVVVALAGKVGVECTGSVGSAVCRGVAENLESFHDLVLRAERVTGGLVACRVPEDLSVNDVPGVLAVLDTQGGAVALSNGFLGCDLAKQLEALGDGCVVVDFPVSGVLSRGAIRMLGKLGGDCGGVLAENGRLVGLIEVGAAERFSALLRSLGRDGDFVFVRVLFVSRQGGGAVDVAWLSAADVAGKVGAGYAAQLVGGVVKVGESLAVSRSSEREVGVEVIETEKTVRQVKVFRSVGLEVDADIVRSGSGYEMVLNLRLSDVTDSGVNEVQCSGAVFVVPDRYYRICSVDGVAAGFGIGVAGVGVDGSRSGIDVVVGVQGLRSGDDVAFADFVRELRIFGGRNAN